MTTMEELKTWVESRRVNENSIDKTISQDELKLDAVHIVEFASKYWTADQNRPGLESARLGISKDILFSIEYALKGLDFVKGRYLEQMKFDGDKKAHLAHGQRLLKDFVSFIEWYIASSDTDEWEDKAERMLHDNPEMDMDSPDGLARALFDYASLAKEILEQEEQVGGISLKTVEEASDVVVRLVDVTSNPIPFSDEAVMLINLKFRIAAILRKDVDKIRKAAQFVFRHHPEVLKDAADTNVSRKRSASYRNKKINQAFHRRDHQTIPLRLLPQS